MAVLLKANHARPEMVFLTGSSEIFPFAHVWQADMYALGYPVCVLDCAIRFNPFILVDEAFKRNIAPDFLLTRVQIQRAFTPYQILDALKSILAKEANHKNVYFILAPCKQFFDGVVAEDEAVFLLNKMLELFVSLQNRGISFFVIEKNNYRHPAFSGIYQKIYNLSNSVWMHGVKSIAGKNSSPHKGLQFIK